jgi:leader peptidase (prepilin peptidase)/N-methyltransferase
MVPGMSGMNVAARMAEMGPGWQAYLGFIAFCLGACVGSFLNVCIYRIPRGLSVVTPGSHCPHCNHPIAARDNIPLLSFLILRARCRHCGGRISPRYVLVELLMAVLFLLVWVKFAPPVTPRLLHLAPIADLRLVPVFWLAIAGLVLGTFVDFEHMILPDRVTLGGIATGLVLSALLPGLHGRPTALSGLLAGAVGAAVGFGLLWLVRVIGSAVFRKEAMGMGDIKLLGAIGAYLGWPAVLFTIMVSSLAGSLAGLGLVLAGRKELRGRIPYGPYIALAALLWILWGPTLWDAYLRAMALSGVAP